MEIATFASTGMWGSALPVRNSPEAGTAIIPVPSSQSGETK